MGSGAYPTRNAGAPTSEAPSFGGGAFVRPRTSTTETNAFGRRSAVMGTSTVGMGPVSVTRRSV